jgi:hypothetical protein
MLVRFDRIVVGRLQRFAVTPDEVELIQRG